MSENPKQGKLVKLSEFLGKFLPKPKKQTYREARGKKRD